jgi:hypothetical protein
MLIAQSIKSAVEAEIQDFSESKLDEFVGKHGPYVIKFVQSRWADHYSSFQKLKISETPALTWGTATYVTPLCFPLSSAMYGRIGLVTRFDPKGWKVFDCTRPSARQAYVRWARAQPSYSHLLLTVHSTFANHLMRNQFREFFGIDCVIFHPDQEAESHTDMTQHMWLAVTDWKTIKGKRVIDSSLSKRLSRARFTVLIDEDFRLEDGGLPIQLAKRQIEAVTEVMHKVNPMNPVAVSQARLDPRLPQTIAQIYNTSGYLHVYIEP